MLSPLTKPTNKRSLFIRCLQIVAPSQDFDARMLELAVVLSPSKAAVAKHTFSILGSSYLEMGGLNTALGGDKSMATIAMKASSELWELAEDIQQDHEERLQVLRHRTAIEEAAQRKRRARKHASRNRG